MPLESLIQSFLVHEVIVSNMVFGGQGKDGAPGSAGQKGSMGEMGVMGHFGKSCGQMTTTHSAYFTLQFMISQVYDRNFSFS